MPERTPEFNPQTRDRQLRRRAIVLAKLQGGYHQDRYLPAPRFLKVADDAGEMVRDEEECLAMLEHLIEHGLIEEWQPVERGSAVVAFAQRRFRLTKRGYALWSQDLDPIPSIADERLGD